MEKTIGVLQTVLPVIVMLGIGMLLRAKKLISREGINTLKFVVVNITLPAVLLSAFATTRYTWMDVVIPLLMAAAKGKNVLRLTPFVAFARKVGISLNWPSGRTWQML